MLKTASDKCTKFEWTDNTVVAHIFTWKSRQKLIWFIRIVMPITFFIWANITAATAWAILEVMFGFMAWMNVLTLLYLLPKVKKVYDDYMLQRKAGVEEPYFNPEKLGLSGQGMDLWMDINKDRIAAEAAKQE